MCCRPYIAGAKVPESAEQLMRSRYTAYTQSRIDYIKQTMAKKAAEHFDEADAKQWADSVKWLGLKVENTYTSKKENNIAFVQYFAQYQSGDRKEFIYETSEFHLHEGKWLYVDGIHHAISKNQLCPCGSGKKFKRCCE